MVAAEDTAEEEVLNQIQLALSFHSHILINALQHHTVRVIRKIQLRPVIARADVHIPHLIEIIIRELLFMLVMEGVEEAVEGGGGGAEVDVRLGERLVDDLGVGGVAA